jgi:hypothetical protein
LAANRKAFSHFSANPVLREMVKNQSPRLTGAAFFCDVTGCAEFKCAARRPPRPPRPTSGLHDPGNINRVGLARPHLVLLPFQLIGLVSDLRLRRTIPHLYHRILCALIGVRIREVGTDRRRWLSGLLLSVNKHII